MKGLMRFVISLYGVMALLFGLVIGTGASGWCSIYLPDFVIILLG